MKYRCLLVVLCLWKSVCSYGQPPVPPGTEIQELVKIAQVYETIPYLSFDLRYTFADSLTWETLTDSIHATGKLSYGRSFVSNDTFEYLKGHQYDVFVDKEDSTIFAIPRKGDEGIFSVPFLDSLFLATQVDSMWTFSINDSNWIFKATFHPQSFYSYYEMRYDPRKGLIQYITFHAQNPAGAHDIPMDHIICAFVHFTNYSEAELDQAIFNEAKYFYRLNGSLYLQPAWDDFELENL